MGVEHTLRFDQYSVQPTQYGMQVVQLIMDIDLVFAIAMAGITVEEFEQSMTHTGWVGTSPDWLKNLPIVTVPKDERLGPDQLDFMLEVLESQID